MSIDLPMLPHELVVVYGAYLVATASPGPSTMAIMGVAMNSGRQQALALAAGVLTGSVFWAILAGTGVSVVLASYTQLLMLLKVLGGVYLLYLAWKSARSAMAAKPFHPGGPTSEHPALRTRYVQGLLLHLTNPKAILAWLAIMSLGVGGDDHPSVVPMIIGGCALLGTITFGSYALAFSTKPMVRLYAKARRGIEAALAMFFGFAGLRLLLTRA